MGFAAVLSACLGAAGYRTELWLSVQRLRSNLGQTSEYLDGYLSQARRALREMKLLAERDHLNLESKQDTAKALWKLATQYPDVGYLNYGLSNGDFIGVGQTRPNSGVLVVEHSTSKSFNKLLVYAINSKGEIGKQIQSKPWADFRQDDWYKKPLGKAVFTWAGVYNWTDDPSVMVIGSGIGINKTGQPYATAGVDLFIEQINHRLRTISAKSQDAIAITEANDILLAASTPQKTFDIIGQKVERRYLKESPNPQLRIASLYKPVSGSQSQTVQLQDTLIASLNWTDGMGLELRIVAARSLKELQLRWLAASLILASVITIQMLRRVPLNG